MKNLDLYARVEPFIGFDKEYDNLYKIYLKELSNYNIHKILDVGCGNGNMLVHLQKNYDAKGIDLSNKMVQIARKKGVKVSCQSLSSIDEKYDAILAIADVLNYLDYKELNKFLDDVFDKLNDNGIFICDINTLFGFEDVTAGSLIIDKNELFITIDSEFEDGKLYTSIVLFEKNRDCYTKDKAKIVQYYHQKDEIIKLSKLKYLKTVDISLFSDEYDKNMLIFQKRR